MVPRPALLPLFLLSLAWRVSSRIGCRTMDRQQVAQKLERFAQRVGRRELLASDCSASYTDPKSQYKPENGFTYEIRTVVHVLINPPYQVKSTTHAFSSSDETCLNEGFTQMNNGFKGTEHPSLTGVDTGIQFSLSAIVYADMSGMDPAIGNIIESISPTQASYTSLEESIFATERDPTQFLNVYIVPYTATGSGLGIASLPWLVAAGYRHPGIIVGAHAWGPCAQNGNQDGATAIHEIGHFLGLWHTFDSYIGSTTPAPQSLIINTVGCLEASAPACYQNGDLICDTNVQVGALYADEVTNCNSEYSCGTPDPIHNYMSYSDDGCMVG